MVNWSDPGVISRVSGGSTRICRGERSKRLRDRVGEIDFGPVACPNRCMTATVEQTQEDLLKLVHLTQQGEDVIITNQGRAVAKLVPVGQGRPAVSRHLWIERLRKLRTATTGRPAPTTEQILKDLRSVRD